MTTYAVSVEHWGVGNVVSLLQQLGAISLAAQG